MLTLCVDIASSVGLADGGKIASESGKMESLDSEKSGINR